MDDVVVCGTDRTGRMPPTSILVLMEYSLREVGGRHLAECNRGVLILVLMEYGLRGHPDTAGVLGVEVLILVLMEYGLRGFRGCFFWVH